MSRCRARRCFGRAVEPETLLIGIMRWGFAPVLFSGRFLRRRYRFWRRWCDGRRHAVESEMHISGIFPLLAAAAAIVSADELPRR